MDLSVRSTDEFLELVNLIHRLELKSHTSALVMDTDHVQTGKATGGGQPSGGADRRDDKQDGYWLRSADHYRRRAEGARSTYAVGKIMVDLRRTMAAWERSPTPSQPIPGSPFFGRYVRESDKSVGELARLTGVSRSYLHRLRAG